MSSPLALLGGTPVTTAPSPHHTWPPIDDDTKDAVARQLATSISIYDRSGVIEDLENALKSYFGVKHALLTSSGTAALHSMYAACGIELGDEVIVPAYTFHATVSPLFHLGAIPVLADCDESGNISANDVAARITPRTVAIVATHMWGLPASLVALRALADRHDLMLLEDGSHAHGASSTGGRKVGTGGRAAAFSMNGPKPLSAGEGGFILTNDDEVFYRALLHGHYNKRCRAEIPSEHPMHDYSITGMGLKLRIHPLAAAVALQQLSRLDDYLDGRERVANHLCEQLGGLPSLATPLVPKSHRASWYGFPISYQPEELDGLPIATVHKALLAEGLIDVDRPGSTRPLNQLALFQNPEPLFPFHPGARQIRYKTGDFPVAEALHHNTLKLPVWHDPDDQPIADAYVEGFRKVITNHHDLKGRS